MPCYRCGARQTDPDRGQSPWKRGVRNDCQVLVCPDCQAARDWTADLARCSRCASVHLVRRLGEVECRDCGRVLPPSSGPPPSSGRGADPGAQGAGPHGAGAVDPGALDPGALDPGGADPGVAGLSEEVARALDRVLGRSEVSGWAVNR